MFFDVTGVTAAINQLSNLGTNVAAFISNTYSKSDVYTKTESDDRYVRQDSKVEVSEVGALTTGSITDTFGAIDIGNDSLKAGSLEIEMLTLELTAQAVVLMLI